MPRQNLRIKPPKSLEPFLYKYSGVETPDKQQFEVDLFNMALLFFQDRAASLLPYMIGFELVERTDDGAKAVGIFGCKVGANYYYVPVFFINNQIRGVDILYSRRYNLMHPLQEGWINYIISKNLSDYGEGSSREDVQKDFETPNFLNLLKPPVVKYSASKDVESPVSFVEVWNTMKDSVVQSLNEDPHFQKAWARFICSTKQAEFVDEDGGDSELKQWISKYGDERAIISLLKTAQKDVMFANSILSFYPSFESLCDIKFKNNTGSKQSLLKIAESVEEGMSDEEKHKLIVDGFAIIDRRPEESKTKVYDLTTRKSVSNPSEPGLYQIVLRGGESELGWVLFSTDKQEPQRVFVVLLKNPAVIFSADNCYVYVYGDRIAGVESLYKYSDPVNKIKYGDHYLLFNDKGYGAIVATKAIERDKSGNAVAFRGYFANDFVQENLADNTMSLLDVPKSIVSDERSTNLSPYKFVISNKCNKLRCVNSLCVIPETYRILALPSPSEVKVRPELGSFFDVEFNFLKRGFHKLTVASDDQGIGYYFIVDDNFKSDQMNKKAAYISLVTKFGLSCQDAESLLSEASEKYKARRMIKAGQLPDVQFGSVPNSLVYNRNMSSAAPLPEQLLSDAVMLQGRVVGAPPAMTDPNRKLEDAHLILSEEIRQLANEAAQSGQKQVFDHAAIGGLVKLYNVHSVIDSYLPEMIKALDRIGRILFLFYWKNEEFADRYGLGDLPQMEDLIRTVFRSFGDLVLQMLQKSIKINDIAFSE